MLSKQWLVAGGGLSFRRNFVSFVVIKWKKMRPFLYNFLSVKALPEVFEMDHEDSSHEGKKDFSLHFIKNPPMRNCNFEFELKTNFLNYFAANQLIWARSENLRIFSAKWQHLRNSRSVELHSVLHLSLATTTAATTSTASFTF